MDLWFRRLWFVWVSPLLPLLLINWSKVHILVLTSPTHLQRSFPLFGCGWCHSQVDQLITVGCCLVLSKRAVPAVMWPQLQRSRGKSPSMHFFYLCSHTKAKWEAFKETVNVVKWLFSVMFRKPTPSLFMFHTLVPPGLTLFCFSVWTSGRRPVLGRQRQYSGRNFRVNNLKASKKTFLENYIRLWQDTYHYKGMTETLKLYHYKKNPIKLSE